MFGFNRKAEKREAQVTQSSPNFLEVFGVSGDGAVSMEEALGVPAVWAAVNFISGTMAGLPLNVYQKGADGVKSKVRGTAANPVVNVLHGNVNDSLSSFQWRFNLFNSVLTEGRDVTFIERDASNRVVNLFPLPGAKAKLLPDGRKQYEYGSGDKKRVYDESEVLDMTFMLRADRVSHRSPIRQCAVALGKAVHANQFGSKLFKNGGLPAFALTGPFGSGKSAMRASHDIAEATKEAARKGGNVLAIPLGHDLKPLGGNAGDLQLVQAQEFAVVEIARIYSLPPTFLQDLSRATFSNSEQQDLHLVKHTLKRWVEQFEAELNLKIFGRNSNRFAEFNLDGLLRGDYKTRMEGNSTAIQTGQLTPDEARAMDNRPPLPGGDKLYIQGATVPLDGHAGSKEGPAPLADSSEAKNGTT